MLGAAAAAGGLTGSACVAVGIATGVTAGVTAVSVGVAAGVTTGVTTGVATDSLSRVLAPTELAGFRARDTMVVTATVTIPTGIKMSVARASPRTRCCWAGKLLDSRAPA